MTHRTDRVFLPAAEPRCQPTKPCSVKGKCARYMSALRGMALMGDYSGLFDLAGECPGFVSVDSLRSGIKAPKPEAKPYMEGL